MRISIEINSFMVLNYLRGKSWRQYWGLTQDAADLWS